jgi:hypothetical protein
MLPRVTLLGLFLCVVFSGCTSISKEECANANWEAVGFRDGSNGKLSSRFNAHQKACAKHGFNANLSRYMDGHHRGLEEVFCKPRKGYQLGLRGAGYSGACPSDLEQQFLPAYNYGLDIYKMELSYRQLNQQVVSLTNQLAKLDERIVILRHATRNDARADHPEGVHELRNERTATGALYDRMNNMRSRVRQSKAFEDHLRHELNAQNKRSERCVTNNVRQPDLTRGERQAIRSIVRLCVEKGHIESQINWMKSTPRKARANRHRRAALQQQLNELMLEINNLNRQLYRHRFSIEQKRHLAHCFGQAEYLGLLQHHQEALFNLRKSHALNTLIDIHFDVEMENLNQRIDFARNHLPSKEARVERQKRQRELHDAKRQRSDYQLELQEIEQESWAI